MTLKYKYHTEPETPTFSIDDGKELVTNLFSAGDFLGYIPLLQGGVYR